MSILITMIDVLIIVIMMYFNQVNLYYRYVRMSGRYLSQGLQKFRMQNSAILGPTKLTLKRLQEHGKG